MACSFLYAFYVKCGSNTMWWRKRHYKFPRISVLSTSGNHNFINKVGSNEIFTLLGNYAALTGSWLPLFQDNVAVPSSSIKQSNKNVRNSWVCSFVGNGVVWSTENRLANRIGEAWRNGKRKSEE